MRVGQGEQPCVCKGVLERANVTVLASMSPCKWEQGLEHANVTVLVSLCTCRHCLS